MGKNYEQLAKKDSPEWLLGLSRSLVKEPTTTSREKDALDYMNMKVGLIQEFDSPQFMESIHHSHKDFFNILKKEASAYHNVFDIKETRGNLYAQEAIKQVKEIYGDKSVDKFVFNQHKQEAISNMVVAVAVNAIHDTALVEYLHLHGKLNDKEKEFGLNEINNRLDRIGINGINRMFKAAPEFEHFIKNDLTIIRTPNPLGVLNQEYTRAAWYNKKIDEINRCDNAYKETIQQELISSTFPELEREKEHYIRLNSKSLSPVAPELRKRYAILNLRDELATPTELAEKKRVGNEIDKDLAKYDRTSQVDAVRVAVLDGIAINHPQRTTYADALRDRMNIAANGELIHGEKKSSGKHTEREKERKNIPSDRETTSNKIDYDPIDDKNKKKASSPPSSEKLGSNADSSSGIGAKIATLGGATAVGLLLAAGSKKDNEHREIISHGDSDSQKEKEPDSRALRFLALAAASAIAVGGAIAWSKKPEFLYKPMKNLINSFSASKA